MVYGTRIDHTILCLLLIVRHTIQSNNHISSLKLGRKSVWGISSNSRSAIKQNNNAQKKKMIALTGSADDNILTFCRGGGDVTEENDEIRDDTATISTGTETATASMTVEEEDDTNNIGVDFHEKVQKALEKLGLSSSSESSAPTSTTEEALSSSSSSSTETETETAARNMAEEEDKDDTNNSNDTDFHDKVHKALEKLGLSSAPTSTSTSTSQETMTNEEEKNEDCEDGVCSISESKNDSDDVAIDSIDEDNTIVTKEEETVRTGEELNELCTKLSSELSLPRNVCEAVVYSSQSEEQAREILTYEKDIVSKVSENSTSVDILYNKEKVSADLYQIRRALAFCDDDIDNARALLLAELDEEEEENTGSDVDVVEDAAPVLPTISVASNLDPTKLSPQSSSVPSIPASPKKVNKSNVPLIYNVTTSTLQSIVLDSPVPVLLDIYAPWCGPCRQLTPILEEMCTKSNGLFRLAKLNSDEERTISTSLDVKGLPTLVGINNGNIVFIQTGSPRTEDEMKQMFMSLVNPKSSQILEHSDLSLKLSEVAGMAAVPFAQRELLQRNVHKFIQMHEQQTDSTATTPGSLEIQKQPLKDIIFIEQMLRNVMQHPKENKYGLIKLSHPFIRQKLYHLDNNKKKKPLFQILNLAGFQAQQLQDNTSVLQLSATNKNLAPMKFITNALNDYIRKKTIFIKNEERKLKDDQDKLNLTFEEDESEDDEDGDDNQLLSNDPNICSVRIRIQQQQQQGTTSTTNKKKKNIKPTTIHLQLNPNNTTLSSILPMIFSSVSTTNNNNTNAEIQFICTAKKLSLSSIKPSHSAIMNQSLKQLGFMPSISLVANIIYNSNDTITSSSPTITKEEGDNKEELLRKRRNKQTLKKKKSTGSHTMQSVGIYSKDDNAKGELIDGGGGTWYEHDVSDDEDEENEKKDDENEDDKKDNDDDDDKE